MQKQAVHEIIYIPADFDTRLNRGEQGDVGLYCDMSLMLTYKAIYQTAQSVASHINSGIQISKGGGFTDRDDELTAHPLEFDEVPIFNTTGGYGNAILPGVLVLILQQTMLLGIGMAAGTSRELNRNRELIPVSKHYGGIFRIVFGKALVYFMVYAVLGMYLTLVVPKMFGFVSMVTWTTILGFLLPYILSCVFFGLMLSCLVRYRENVMLLLVSYLSSIAFHDGYFDGRRANPSLLARFCVGIPIHLRHQRIPQNQQHGSIASRYSTRVQSPLDTDPRPFPRHLPGSDPSVALSKTQGESSCPSCRRRG